MTILLTLVAFHMLVLFAGRFVKRFNYLSYLFVGIITVIQLSVFVYLLFTMEVPAP